MEKNKVAVSLRKRLPQFCFASQTRSIQAQTDLITNVSIERLFEY